MRRSTLHGQFEAAATSEIVRYDAAFFIERGSAVWSARVRRGRHQHMVAASEPLTSDDLDHAETAVVMAIERAITEMVGRAT